MGAEDVLEQKEDSFIASFGKLGTENTNDVALVGSEGDEESKLAALLASPHSRMVGGTEYSWCRAVSGGTGITALGMLFSHLLDPAALQSSIDRLQIRHPRLRSRLVWIYGRPALAVSPEPFVKVQVQDDFEKYAGGSASEDRSFLNGEVPCSDVSVDDNVASTRAASEERKCEDCVSMPDEHEHPAKECGGCKGVLDGKEQKQWLRLVERELNTNDWEEHYHCLDPRPMFAVRIYKRAAESCVLVLRLHTAICDRVSAATILRELLLDFSETELVGELPDGRAVEEVKESALVAIEDVIPAGKADKPFWAHGLDIVGYSLGSRRHAWLPFNDASQSRRSEVVCQNLSVQHTQLLLQMCSAQKCCRIGALSAAGLMATARLKQLGSRTERFAVVTLIDCRNELDPVFPDSTVGFYHSAVLNTHSATEGAAFWELARRCSSSLENALRNRKHFTDMGDVNFLMCQAIQFPHLTPADSLRTSLMSIFREPLFDDMQELKQAAGVVDYVGCSSIHGVGPSIAIFDSIQQGALKCCCVYPSPLHSRTQMTAFVNAMMGNITHALSVPDQ